MEEDSVLVESPCGGVGETNTPIPSPLTSSCNCSAQPMRWKRTAVSGKCRAERRRQLS